MCLLQFPDCLRMFSCCTFECNSQNLRIFRDNRRSESSSFVGNKRRGKYACFVITSMGTFATLIAEASVRG